ncbi:MAG: hypothetical protein ABSE62_03060 [Chthoniobacteraceae bacterium]|jgi:hypothetical protein
MDQAIEIEAGAVPAQIVSTGNLSPITLDDPEREGALSGVVERASKQVAMESADQEAIAYADHAIKFLKCIRVNAHDRQAAYQRVEDWIAAQESPQ